MSTEVRTLLADAAGSVEGIDAHPYYVQSTKPGHCHVRLDRIEYPNRFGGLCYWDVVVILPQDLARAEKYIEDKIPAVRDAVADHMTVTRVRPERLIIPNAGEVPCVFITGHREED